MVGAIGFEPTTPCAQGRCATRLRYAPTKTAFFDSKTLLVPAPIPMRGVNLGTAIRRPATNRTRIAAFVSVSKSAHSQVSNGGNN